MNRFWLAAVNPFGGLIATNCAMTKRRPESSAALRHKVIALDFYSQFNQNNPLSSTVSAKYRKAVIDPVATKPAKELATDFLGRPYKMDAFNAWLCAEFK